MAEEEATVTTTVTESVTEEAPDTGPDLNAELEKWKAAARKHEDRAKANAKAAQELEQLKTASMSDLEKAVAQAKAEARTQTLVELGSERVADAVRVAAAGRSVDVDALLDGLDRSRFLTDDGTPDREAIEAWVERIAPKPTEGTFPDLGQGARGATDTRALNGDPLLKDLKNKLGIR